MQVIVITFTNRNGEESSQNVPIEDGQGVLRGIQKFISETHYMVADITSADFSKAPANEDFRLFALFSNTNNKANSPTDEIKRLQDIVKATFDLLSPGQRSQFWSLPSTSIEQE